MIPGLANVSPIVPGGAPADGGEKRWVVTEQIIDNAAAGVYGEINASFRVTNPSTRLLLNIGVTFQPNSSEDATFPTSGPNAWLVRLDAWVRSSRERGGNYMRGNNILSAAPVPFTYDVPPSTVPEIRGQVTIPNIPGTGIVPGKLYVNAIWEINPGAAAISDKELQQLFSLCRVHGIQGLQASQSGA